MPRDVVAGDRTGTKSVRNSLTAMMRVTDVGTVADLIERGSVLTTLSDVIAVIAISTGTGGNAGIAGTVISTTIETGVVTGK